jgi:hypothetical protein
MRDPKISEYQRVPCIWETSMILPACVSCCEQITWLFKCSVLLFVAKFSVQAFFLSFNKQLHVLFDACEYKAAKITKLNKEFLFVVNFELI